MNNTHNSVDLDLLEFFSEGNGRLKNRNSTYAGALMNSLYILYCFFPLYLFGLRFYKLVGYSRKESRNYFRVASVYSGADINIINSVGPIDVDLFMSRKSLNLEKFELIYTFNLGLIGFVNIIGLALKNVIFRKEESLVAPIKIIRRELEKIEKCISDLQINHIEYKFEKDVEFRVLFTNDQTLYSSVFLNILKKLCMTEVVQHGVIRLPEYYFPTRADVFYYWEKNILLMPLRGESSFKPIVKQIYMTGYCNIIDDGGVLIASHSLLSTHRLLRLAKKNEALNTIVIRPHPTSKYKPVYKLYAFINGVGFETEEISAAYIQKYSSLYTEFSTLAIDFAYFGKSVYALEQNNLPNYMDYSIGQHKSCQRMELFSKEIEL